jgi:lysozyme family protein
MVASTYDAAMVRVFNDEGGYINDPKDPGGATNWGITIADARQYWKADATPADVKDMPKSVAEDIYRKHYATPIRYNDLPAGFDYSVLDAGINSGIGRAVKWAGEAMQRENITLNLVVLYSMAWPNKVELIQNYWQRRLSFLEGLSIWGHFGKGWMRRCTQGEAAAVKMSLQFGGKTQPADVQAKMQTEAKKARTASKGAAAGAAGSAASTAAPIHPSINLWHFGTPGKIMTAVLIASLVVAAVYLIRQAIIHNMRASAYASQP